jgi:hypothetical protein
LLRVACLPAQAMRVRVRVRIGIDGRSPAMRLKAAGMESLSGEYLNLQARAGS